jgi:hypothetical protein
MIKGAPGVGVAVAADAVGVPVGAAAGEGLAEADVTGEASGVGVLRNAGPVEGEGEGLTEPDRPGRLQPPTATTRMDTSSKPRWRTKARTE